MRLKALMQWTHTLMTPGRDGGGHLRRATPTETNAAILGNQRLALEATAITVVRERVPILHDINLEIQEGETLSVMGPNGAGKSTLLQCLAGAVQPDGGHIRLYGVPNARARDLRRQIGFVSHECGLYGELTSFENLIFAGRMHGVDRPGQRARQALLDSGLEWTAHRPVRKLSQGLRRRVGIARALVHDPKLILLDEPFASLDGDGRRWLEDLFQKWRRERRIVCFANHDLHQSQLLSDRVVWLQRGRIAANEPPTFHSATLRSA